MSNNMEVNIDQETITKVGLRPSDNSTAVQIAAGTRVFDYPDLENVFIMESDLYGNRMPKGTCFLAFTGAHGLMGRQLSIDVLKSSSPRKIASIVESNNQG
jgi:hypothetical protein